MQIPYEVSARPDTGLYNAKLGIWLFLASEVMLFGGLFSAYIFQRLGAEPGYWPHGLLNVPVGMGNTIVLIASSVTVVLAWAALKMRRWNQYWWFMGITIFCGLLFLVVKLSYEWPQKFVHFGVFIKKDAVAKYEDYLGNKHQAANGLEPRYEISGHLEAVEFERDGKHETVKAREGEEGLHPWEDIEWASAFLPRHSTYFGTYFLITGLHGLHVLAGVIVFAYMWLFGKELYLRNPEHMANRVEVAGLFWHFVDLVWIFVFPIFYLL